LVGGVADGLGDEDGEQALDFVAGERDQSVGAGPVVGGDLVAAFEGGGDGEEGVCEQGQGDPAVPGVPAAYLVFVQSRQCLRALEYLLDRPAASSDLDQCGQGDRAGVSSSGSRPVRPWRGFGGSSGADGLSDRLW
jgi:hypothetical protein